MMWIILGALAVKWALLIVGYRVIFRGDAKC